MGYVDLNEFIGKAVANKKGEEYIPHHFLISTPNWMECSCGHVETTTRERMMAHCNKMNADYVSDLNAVTDAVRILCDTSDKKRAFNIALANITSPEEITTDRELVFRRSIATAREKARALVEAIAH